MHAWRERYWSRTWGRMVGNLHQEVVGAFQVRLHQANADGDVCMRHHACAFLPPSGSLVTAFMDHVRCAERDCTSYGRRCSHDKREPHCERMWMPRQVWRVEVDPRMWKPYMPSGKATGPSVSVVISTRRSIPAERPKLEAPKIRDADRVISFGPPRQSTTESGADRGVVAERD